MTLQVGGNGEASFAELALVGLFSGVGSQVPRQVRRSGEDFSAIFARVSFLGVAVVAVEEGRILMTAEDAEVRERRAGSRRHEAHVGGRTVADRIAVLMRKESGRQEGKGIRSGAV